jgi:SNF2 family DNA or RNA helicase
MDNMDDLFAEEAALQKRMEELRQRRRKLEEEAKKNAPATVNVTSLQNNLVYFSLFVNAREVHGTEARQDITQALAQYSTYSKQYVGKRTISIMQWKDVRETLKSLPNVIVTYTQGLQDMIESYLSEPVWKVQLMMKYLVAKPAAWNRDVFVMYRLEGVTRDHDNNRFLVQFSAAYKLWEALKDIPGVQWEKSALDKVMKQVEERALIDNIATLKVAPEYADYDLNGMKLRPFQTVSQKFADLVGDKIILGDVMGLGKSPQWIARAVIKEYKKCLIIVPAGLVSNWERQILKFTGIQPHIYGGREPQQPDLVRMLMGKDRFSIIPITSVGSAVNDKKADSGKSYPWVDLINMAQYDFVGIDEAHYAKNTSASRTQAVMQLQVPRIWLLTGTPMTNRRVELYPLLRIVRPDLNLTESQIENMSNAALHEILRQVMLRRDRTQVYDDLPSLDRITQLHELSEDARRRYSLVMQGLYEILKTFNPRNAGAQQEVQNILVQIMRLKQICSDDMIESAADLATEIYDSNEGEKYRKIIIFSQFNDVVRAVVRRLGGEALAINGDEHSPQERLKIIDEFHRRDDIHFLVCSSKSVAEGFDITGAGTHINIDLMWTPAAHEQCEGRSYMRQSDPHGITSYYMIAKGTIMEWIWSLLESKMRDIEGVIDGAEKSRLSGSSVVNDLIGMMKNSTFTF